MAHPSVGSWYSPAVRLPGWPLNAPNTPKESSKEVPHNVSSALTGFSPSPSSVPSKAPDPLATPPLHSLKSEEAFGSPSRISSRQPREVKSPVPISHTVPSSWNAISPARQFPSQPTDSLSVPSGDSPWRIQGDSPIPSPEIQNGTTRVRDTEMPFGDAVEPSRTVRDLKPSHSPEVKRDPNYQQLEPSHVFVNPIVTSASVEPTMGPPEDFFPTNTMDVDYGSGDYLETMSFMGSEDNDYSPASNLPSDVYDFEYSNSETYDTTFPTRVVMSFSSMQLNPTSTSDTSHLSSKHVESYSFNSNSTSNVPTTDFNQHQTTFLSSTTTVPIWPTSPVLTTIPSISPFEPNHTISPSLPTIQPTRVHSLLTFSNPSDILNQNESVNESLEMAPDWLGTVTIQPTDVLLPDMNSLEFYTIQMTKNNGSLPDHTTKHITFSVSSTSTIGTTHIVPNSTYTIDPSYMLTAVFDDTLQSADNSSWVEEESSTDISGFEPFNTSTLEPSDAKPSLTNTTVLDLESSFVPTPSIDPSSSLVGQHSTSGLYATPTITYNTSLLVTNQPPPTLEPGSVSSVNETQWIFTSIPTETPFLSTVLSTSAYPTDSTFNLTSPPPVSEMADEEFLTEMPSDTPVTVVTNSDDMSNFTVSPTVLHNDNTESTFATVTTINDLSVTTLSTTLETTTARKYLCNITKPDTYLIRVVEAPPDFVFRAVSGAVVYTAISVINALRPSAQTTSSYISVSPNSPLPGRQYHVHSVLEFVPSHVDIGMCMFSEHIEKGLITALSEVLRRAQKSTNFTVHITVSFVLQILNITMSLMTRQQQKVPVDITFAVSDLRGFVLGAEVSARLRDLSVVEYSYYLGYPVKQIAELLLGVLDQPVNDRVFQASVERKLALLLGDALGTGRRFRRATSVGNNSVQIVQTTRLVGPDNPLEIIYFVEGANGKRLPATTTANMLNSLDMQQAAIVMGYRIQEILAQPVEKQASHPSDTDKTNTWIIVGVVVPAVVVIIIISILYWKLCRTDKLEFQPDTMSTVQQRQKCKTSLQKSPPVIQRSMSKELLESSDEEEEEDDEEEDDEEEEEENDEEKEEEEEERRDEKKPVIAAKTISKKKSIEEEEEEEEEEEAEEEPKKAVNKRLQPKLRALELQTPSVKGFDFAKLHMGQHSKDDLLVIQEPMPLPVPTKEQSPPESADFPTPKSKGSSKASRNAQHRRGQISPSEGESVGSDPGSERASPEDGTKPSGLPSDPKQTRKAAVNGLNGPPPMNNNMDEPLSSASIFEHVDRMSRPTDGPKRPPNKIQLIAMQPMPALPLPSLAANDKAAENAKLSKEIQVALRHKSEIEHHRNKIRLRAKRKGHYDFPAMDDLIDGLGDSKEQDRIYQKAQMQIEKILDPDIHMPSLYTEPKKSNSRKRSPKQKKQLNGDVTDADRDKLISDSDGTYRKYPGVNNIAYVSDPDQGPDPHSPSPTDDVFHSPISPPPGHPPPPPPYLSPQPSIEEARQQMHSLLDDAFALVSPTSQGSTAGITLPGVGLNPTAPPPTSPPSRGPRPWVSGYPPFNPYTGRYAELGLPPSTVQGLLHRQGLGSGYIPQCDALPIEQLQSESLYSGRVGHIDEPPSSARPRPVGGTAGGQMHPLTHAGLPGRINDSRQPGGLNWGLYHEDDNKFANNRDPTSRNGLKEPSAAPTHLDSLGLGYTPSAPPEEPSPPNHSSASLIKAIREELMRLSQKQAAVPSYHS
ncbi:hypothetical protein E1301_Tti008822 [Triplophysa tibetana]|uniref:Uncharacterized protein n=1 Tax=Triplophysa tibetana TaxID=1572043 RepID=A0A5A9P342_9TELE|nr:hypothetical protein E1301_Tti008822 [Triplophysa tibetana]